ncbi:MAG: hypothetical protein QXF58_03260 [Desulfurococcaceae archaeon]
MVMDGKLPRVQAGWVIIEAFNLSYNIFIKLLKSLINTVEWIGVLKAPGSVDVFIAGRPYTIALSPFNIILEDSGILDKISGYLQITPHYIVSRDSWLDYVKLDISFLNEVFSNIEKHGYHCEDRFEIKVENRDSIDCDNVLVVNYSTIIPPNVFGYTTSHIPYNVLEEFWRKNTRVIAICLYQTTVIPLVYVTMIDKKPILYINKACSRKISDFAHYFVIDFISMFESSRTFIKI